MVAKRLYRSQRERILGGVAGGIAAYFDVDPTLVRLAWVLLALSGGVGILGYIIAWIIMPEEPVGSAGRARESEGKRGDGDEAAAGGESGGAPAGDTGEGAGELRVSSNSAAWVFGLILVGLGFFLLIRNFLPRHLYPVLWAFPWWPVLLIFVGAVLLAAAFRRG